MPDFPWDTLLQSIDDGRCTPFIGAGACAGVLPLAGELAEQLVKDDEATSNTACPLPDRRDLVRVAQYLAITRRSGLWPKDRIAELLREKADSMASVPLLHEVLASLDVPVYLTTNYDDFLTRALVAKRPGAVRRYARWSRSLLKRPSRFDARWEPSVKEPLVFHLHGHLDEPGSMVATEDDYIDFIVNLSRDLANPPTGPEQKSILPFAIHDALTSSMLLFVGYGLGDLNFRVILRSLTQSLDLSGVVGSVAIQYSHGDRDEFFAYMRRHFDHSLHIDLHSSPAEDFARELRERLRTRR